MDKTFKKCFFCGEILFFDERKSEYVCRKCGQRYKMTDYINAFTNKKTKKKYVEKLKRVMSSRVKNRLAKINAITDSSSLPSEQNQPVAEEKPVPEEISAKKETKDMNESGGEKKYKTGEMGKCVICDREQKIVAHDACGSCFPIGKKFKWNIEKARQFRAEHPIGERKKRTGGGKGTPPRTPAVPPVPPTPPAPAGPEAPVAALSIPSVKKMKIRVEYEVEVMKSTVVGIEVSEK